LSDRTPACEEEKVLVKRPKLMEADEAMAVDNSELPSSSEVGSGENVACTCDSGCVWSLVGTFATGHVHVLV